MAKKCCEWLRELLSGQIKMEDAPKPIQSWARYFIYEGAREICLMEWIGDRKAAMEKIPPNMRPYIEAEVKRLWRMRREL